MKLDLRVEFLRLLCVSGEAESKFLLPDLFVQKHLVQVITGNVLVYLVLGCRLCSLY